MKLVNGCPKVIRPKPDQPAAYAVTIILITTHVNYKVTGSCTDNIYSFNLPLYNNIDS